jgi:hypothetical protein
MKALRRRIPRLPKALRRRINRRAYELAGKAFERYRAELHAAIAEDPVLINEIDTWRPSDQRG